MPLLTLPLALFALVGVPALMAIYWLRNRYRRQTVSSLHLWLDHRDAREGGTRVKRLQFPLLLLLELLALILLAVAATDPRVLMGSDARPIVVVLDDSFSMQAGARDAAATKLVELLRKERRFVARLLLAGTEPRALGDMLTTVTEVQDALPAWRCQSPAADLDKAIALAGEIGGEHARILVLTDHRSPQPLAEGKVQWWSLGTPDANVAIINAVRSGRDEDARALIEVANLSPNEAVTSININGSLRQLAMSAGEVRRIWLEGVDPETVIQASLPADRLPFDNDVLLLPEDATPLRVRMDLRNEKLRELLTHAVQASAGTIITRQNPDLLITDDEQPPPTSADCWVLRLVVDAEAAAFVGPFIVDQQHALTDGVELAGVVWGAEQNATLPGRTLIAAGNTSLLSVVDRAGITIDAIARYDIHMRFAPDVSSLQTSPNFPVLIWNVLDWRREFLPGLRNNNVRLGAQVTVNTAQGVDRVTITDPAGALAESPALGRQVVMNADQRGLYAVDATRRLYRFAVNPLARDESDLRNAATAEQGNWTDEQTLRRQYSSIAWVGLLAALLILAAHSLLVSRAGGRA